MISLEVRHFAVFPITISAPDFCASSHSFCSVPCGRKSSASKKNRYFPSAFCNPQFLAPAPPRFSSSITTSFGYRFSYSLKISAEPSVEPSLTQITSKSCVNFCPQIESKHLLRVPAALYTGIITDTAQLPRNVNSLHSTFPGPYFFQHLHRLSCIYDSSFLCILFPFQYPPLFPILELTLLLFKKQCYFCRIC